METQATTNKKLVKNIFEKTWKTRTISPLAAFIADDITYHKPGVKIFGKVKYLHAVQECINAFENAKLTIEDQIAVDDQVFSRFYFSGKHVNTFMDIPATHRMVMFEGMNVVQIINGMITKEWEIYDELGLVKQFGLELAQKEHIH